jgi:6-phosphofructokinase 1
MAEKRVGVLTGGGDAPGLNPAIKGLVYRGSELGLEVVGLFDGWRSLMNPAPDVMKLDRETVRRSRRGNRERCAAARRRGGW